MKLGDTCKVGETTYELVKQPKDPVSACAPCAGRLKLKDGITYLCGSLGECFAWGKEGERITCVWLRKAES